MFEKQLRHAALFAQDRTVMYKMLKGISKVPEVLLSEEAGTNDVHEIRVAEQPEIPNEFVAVNDSQTNEEHIITSEPKEMEPASDTLTVNPFHGLEEISEDENSPIEITPLIEDIPKEIPEPANVNEIPFSPEEEIPVSSMDAETESEVLILEPIMGPPFLEVLEGVKGMSFADWMDRKVKPVFLDDIRMEFQRTSTDSFEMVMFRIMSTVGDAQERKVEVVAPLIADNDLNNIESSFFKDEKTNSDEAQDLPLKEQENILTKPKEVSTPPTDTILERFIQSNPTITRPKASFFNPSDAAQKSLEEHDDIYTETLAKVYIRQEKLHKAIQVYEKLMLKFPSEKEKFAALIQQLKHPLGK